MRKHPKHPIALALGIAGIVAGTSAGIAAIGNEVAEYINSPATLKSEQAERRAVSEVLVPSESNVAVETPAPLVTQATQAPATLTPAEGITPQTQQIAAPALSTAHQRVTTRSAKDDEYQVRLPFTNVQFKVTVPTFPGNSSEYPDPSPAVVAYYDRKNANTLLAGAPGSVFPSGADGDSHQVLPATVAYFDRVEARRLAAQQPATPPVAAVPAVTGDSVVATISEGPAR